MLPTVGRLQWFVQIVFSQMLFKAGVNYFFIILETNGKFDTGR